MGHAAHEGRAAVVGNVFKKPGEIMNLIIFGPPGAGKGTQASFITSTYNAEHISTGDLLRDAVKRQTETGVMAKSYMDKGELVPDEVVIDIIREKIGSLDGAGFLFDGFPRTIEQARSLDGMLESQNLFIEAVLYLKVDEDEVVERLLKRAELEGREDDNEGVIRNRLDVYRKQTLPLADYYRSKGIFNDIEGTGTIDDVRERINSVVSGL